MVDESSTLQQRLAARFEDRVAVSTGIGGQITIEVPAEQLAEIARVLRDEPEFGFEQLIDVCGIDYLGFGQDEWETEDVSSEGFSRGVEGAGPGRFRWADRPAVVDGERRFAAIVHLLSIRNNHRLRIRCFCPDDSLPMVPSLTAIWPVANWFEREAFDLFGIVFEGHPDLRRILTDYGFVGHPFRKDFPLIGNVEVLYDAERGRVVYQPVTIEPRVTVPRVVRHDSRFQQAASEQALADQAIAPQGK